jgi:hypothetical protein
MMLHALQADLTTWTSHIVAPVVSVDRVFLIDIDFKEFVVTSAFVVLASEVARLVFWSSLTKSE